MTFRVTYSVVNADLTELHREFDAALASTRAARGQTFPSWIDGHPSETGDLLESRSPSDGRAILAQFHRADEPAVARAVDAAHRAQSRWAKTPWQERVKRLVDAADVISKRRMELAVVASLEVGKNRLESLGDVEESADLLRYYASQVSETNGFVRPLRKLTAREDTRDLLRPYGVFAVISPFNFPMALAAGMSSAALLAGNSVILKPSEATPWCAQLLYECLRDAGVPDGVFQILQGEGETVGATLARHPRVDGVAFTGSTGVGMELFHLMSSERVRPCLLEMGGKNAAVVCESATLDEAVEGCVRSAFGLSGQKCSALSRIYVARSLHPEFLARLSERVASLAVGDPTRADTFMGPVIDTKAVERYERASAEARTYGAVHTGGTRLTEGDLQYGHFVAPTVATLPRDRRLNREELFLPFVNVDAFDSFEEALALVNDVDHGLTAGIFSRLDTEIDAFMDGAEAGVLYANRAAGATTGAWPGVQSFCGWKASGSSGKGGCGPYYVMQFAREQSQTRVESK
jgi:1-pyrroline-5-carboxylate dehydrogenase